MNFIEHLEGLITSKVARAKGLIKLFELEAQLASLNIVPLCVSLGALIAFFFTTWLTVMVLIGYLLMLLVGPLLSIIIVLLLNIVALLLIIKNLSACIKEMTFEKTRAFLVNNSGEEHHELAKKTKKLNKPSRN